MIVDLQVKKSFGKSVLLQWTAPSKSEADKKYVYDIRYSKSEITKENFFSCTAADVTVVPREPGVTQNMYVNELETGVLYYFAMRLINVNSEIGVLSNVVSATPKFSETPTEEVTVDSVEKLVAEIENAGDLGKIITLAPGNYYQDNGIVLNDKDYITIQGATDNWDDTVLWGQGQYGENGRNVDINLKLYNCQYFTIKNLTIRDSYHHAIQANEASNYFYAVNVKTLNSGESGYKTTGGNQLKKDFIYCDYGIIEDCYIGNVESASGVNGVVEGIDGIASKGWIVRNCVFENIISPPGGLGYAVFFKANSIDSIYENNLFINCDIALSFGGGGSGPEWLFRYNDASFEHRGGVMKNNISHGSVRNETGIFINCSTGFDIYDNIIWDGAKWGSVNFRTSQIQYANRKLTQSGKIYNNALRYGIEEYNPTQVIGDNIILENNTELTKESADKALKERQNSMDKKFIMK